MARTPTVPLVYTCSPLKFFSNQKFIEGTVQFQYFQFRYFQRAKKIQILISVPYPIFSARHKCQFSKCQNFRVTRCTILIFLAFSIFSSDIFSHKQLKILELNCNCCIHVRSNFALSSLFSLLYTKSYDYFAFFALLAFSYYF